MPIIVSSEILQNLLNEDWLKLRDVFWSEFLQKLLSQQCRIASQYVAHQQMKEEKTNEFIISRSYPSNVGSKLPRPKPHQKRRQEYYLKGTEGATTYEFYDYKTSRPTKARWLQQLLDQWDLKFNNPHIDPINEYRDLETGDLKKGKPVDDLLDFYLLNRDEMNAVLRYCENFSDEKIMLAEANIGGQRGPLGEFASAAQKVFVNKIREQKEKSQRIDRHDLLVDCASNFFSTFKSLKESFKAFMSQLKSNSKVVSVKNNPDSYEINITEELANRMVMYCQAVKCLITHAMEFEEILREYFLSDEEQQNSLVASDSLRRQKSERCDDVRLLLRSLFEIIVTLNSRINDFVVAKLVEVEPEDYKPALDLNPSPTIKIKLPLTEDKLQEYLQKQIQSVARAAKAEARRQRMVSLSVQNDDGKIPHLSSPVGNSLAVSGDRSTSRSSHRTPRELGSLRRERSISASTTSPRAQDLHLSAQAALTSGAFSPRGQQSLGLIKRSSSRNHKKGGSSGEAGVLSPRGSSVGVAAREGADLPKVDRSLSIMEQAAAKTRSNAK